VPFPTSLSLPLSTSLEFSSGGITGPSTARIHRNSLEFYTIVVEWDVCFYSLGLFEEKKTSFFTLLVQGTKPQQSCDGSSYYLKFLIEKKIIGGKIIRLCMLYRVRMASNFQNQNKSDWIGLE
jgi:hypothetical protein